jgi:deaminated glutathione amidase
MKCLLTDHQEGRDPDAGISQRAANTQEQNETAIRIPDSMSKIAAIQMASGPNVHANLIEAGRLIADAVNAGARMVVLPENFALMGLSERDKLEVAEPYGKGPLQSFLSNTARSHGVWIVGGTIPVHANTPGKIRSACLLYDATGLCVARYDKIHLFDVHIDETDENYIESETIEQGEDITVVDTPFGKLGLAICYDLRFPELYRRMMDEGMELLCLPSAFTAITGKAHWEVLVRARAIENLCFVVASDQGGYHINGRETHGDSMIVDPWGRVLDRLPRGSGFVIADIQTELVKRTRKSFPAIDHRRLVCSVS